ncbi:hypothetical protein I4I73_02760 [Pseudonocardia sp. KRD-184]|uniref:PH domain-containing protein n=1 Tax=Pseudonocardia oceani TaxID=2792013 RepID=A0ABS6U5Y4_9PSEU|nr:hypothetical protein [Pseudonocardia oceani]MBW0090953.1 hypothetical protein [Pseudonocardia oceani]MBW0094918.1 hypothetical protein [Pseudonocardia oceani]MBW0109275.1 hypothetical protein [Pseudonocardia oceani]MBW0120763.1 hypothetical protein [Pseudonocardia oceani]MBW0127644.1 hypothetical protein [Pseudonocardia oceani]
MAEPGVEGVARWPLRGSWLTWLRVSALIGLVLLVAGAVLVVLVVLALAGGSLPGVVPGLVVLAVGAVVGWQVAHTAHDVVLHADGTLVVRRPRGPLRTRVGAVTAVRPSRLRSSRTPTVLETTDGWAYLIHDEATRAELVAALAP